MLMEIIGVTIIMVYVNPNESYPLVMFLLIILLVVTRSLQGTHPTMHLIHRLLAANRHLMNLPFRWWFATQTT